MNWLKLLKIAIPIVLILVLFWLIFDTGRDYGKAVVTNQWEEQKKKEQKEEEAARKRIEQDEAAHIAQSRKIDYELSEIKALHAGDVARINSNTLVRLRDSEEREKRYLAASEGAAVERANLASYAAKLDRSLAEGIGLVEELRTTIELRDGQLKSLGAQIQSDRQLINGSGNANGINEHAGS